MEHKRVVDLPNIKEMAVSLAMASSPTKQPAYTKVYNIFIDILTAHEYHLLGWFMSHADGFLPTQTQGAKVLRMDTRTFKKTLNSLIVKLDHFAESINKISADLKDFKEGRGVVNIQPSEGEGLLNYKGGGCKNTRTSIVKIQPNKNNKKTNKQDIKEKIYKKESEMVLTNPTPPINGESLSFDDESSLKSYLIQNCNKNPKTIQRIVSSREDFETYLLFYINYYLNLPPKKRVYNPYRQFINSIIKNWAQIRKNNQPVKTFHEKKIDEIRDNYLKNRDQSDIDYDNYVMEFNKNQLKSHQGGNI